jgi:protein involved in polysaccharide export with SLBB domain
MGLTLVRAVFPGNLKVELQINRCLGAVWSSRSSLFRAARVKCAALIGLWLALGWAAAHGQASRLAPTNRAAPGVVAADAGGSARKPDQLGPGDRLQFFVQEDPVKGPGPIELLVSPVGDVSFPVSRNSDILIAINVAGKPIARIKQELKAKLDADYYWDATVFLKVSDQLQRRKQILLSGEVRSNVLSFGAGETVTLFEAIVKAGYTEFANLKKVHLNRFNSATQKTEGRVIDVDAMFKGDRTKDIPLEDGDHIEIRQKTIVGF